MRIPTFCRNRVGCPLVSGPHTTDAFLQAFSSGLDEVCIVLCGHSRCRVAKQNSHIFDGDTAREEVGRKGMPEHVGMSSHIGVEEDSSQRALPIGDGGLPKPLACPKEILTAVLDRFQGVNDHFWEGHIDRLTGLLGA